MMEVLPTMAQYVYLVEQSFRDLMKQAVSDGLDDAHEVLVAAKQMLDEDVEAGVIHEDTCKQIETFVAVQFIANYMGKIAIQGIPVATPGPVRLK